MNIFAEFGKVKDMASDCEEAGILPRILTRLVEKVQRFLHAKQSKL